MWQLGYLDKIISRQTAGKYIIGRSHVLLSSWRNIVKELLLYLAKNKSENLKQLYTAAQS